MRARAVDRITDQIPRICVCYRNMSSTTRLDEALPNGSLKVSFVYNRAEGRLRLT